MKANVAHAIGLSTFLLVGLGAAVAQLGGPAAPSGQPSAAPNAPAAPASGASEKQSPSGGWSMERRAMPARQNTAAGAPASAPRDATRGGD